MDPISRLLVTGALSAALGLSLGAVGSWKVASLVHDAKELRKELAQPKADEKLRKDLKPVEEAQAKSDAAAPVRVVTATKVVEKIVEKPVYRNVCLDAEGVDYINKIISGEGP